MKTTEYVRGNWKPDGMSIKGNPESKAALKKLIDKKHIKTEGEALDYLVKYYHATVNAAPASGTSDKANAKSLREVELEKLVKEMESTHKEKVNDLSDQLKKLSAKSNKADILLQNPEYLKFKKETERVIPKLFRDSSIEEIAISDEDFLTLLVDYAVRDPSKEFPFQPFAEKIYKRFKSNPDAQNNISTEPQEENTSSKNKKSGNEEAGAGDGTEDGNAPD